MKNKALESITQVIIKQIETAQSQTSCWKRPWITLSNNGFAFNTVSKKEYTGVNRLILGCASFDHQTSEFATYKQWLALDKQVSKGSTGYPVVYFNNIKKVDKNTGEESFYPMIKTYTVFNIDQTEGFEPAEKVKRNWNDCSISEQLVKDSGAKILHKAQSKAFYSPSNDQIVMPLKDQFKTDQGYYSTLLHELGHWTGHESRLNRDFSKKFGDSQYAFEELVAELTSAFLCNYTGIEDQPRDDHAKYLKSWVKVLKDDTKNILKAASLAEKAFSFITTQGKEQSIAA